MTAIIPLGIVSLVLSFLIGITGSFPGVGSDVEAINAEVEWNTAGSAEAVGSLFIAGFTGVIDDIMSHQANPDYERAEAKRVEMLGFAEALIPQFEDLSQELTKKLETLTPGEES